MSLLQASDVTVRRGGRAVVRDVSLSVGEGECVALLGPNGAGKTTLLRALLGLAPFEGRSSLAALPPLERARRAAWLPQTREIAWPVPVRDLVALGRHPHARGGAAGRQAVEGSLMRLGLGALANRPATELSGGEQARVLLARALAQETPLILADEPVAGLDPARQIEAMATLAALAREGRGVLVSVHDLSLALRHATRAVVMADGRVVADGSPTDVLTPVRLAEVFGIRAHRVDTPDGVALVAADLAPAEERG